MADERLSGLIEFFVRQYCGFFDLKADFKERREGVGEIANAECSDQTTNVTEFGDSTCHDEGQGPIAGYHGDPDELASLSCECREVYYFVLEVTQWLEGEDIGSLTKKLHKDVVVYDLDADVSIQGSGNQTTCCWTIISLKCYMPQ
jgi:hypothetical protein